MSWSVNIIGKPDAVVKELEKESVKLKGDCKEEFDAALPHMKGLLEQNYTNDASYAQVPMIHFEASGSGTKVNGQEKYRNCVVKMTALWGKFVTAIALLAFLPLAASAQLPVAAPLEKRVEALEKKVADLEKQLKVATSAPVAKTDPVKGHYEKVCTGDSCKVVWVPDTVFTPNKTASAPCPAGACADCSCAGGGYYCAPGNCPVAFGTSNSFSYQYQSSSAFQETPFMQRTGPVRRFVGWVRGR